EEREFINGAREKKGDIRKFIETYSGKLKTWFVSSEKRKLTCRWPFEKSFITVDGFVTPCCIRMDPEVINFGNIFETPFRDIWNSKQYRDIRGTLVGNLSNPVCDNCPD
ncbi:MAG: SPASM domain-containing protein, partial [Candidatus Omnitrophota bacterium]